MEGTKQHLQWRKLVEPFDVTARAALRLQQEANGPTLAAVGGLLKCALGIVERTLAGVLNETLENGTNGDVITNTRTINLELAADCGEVPLGRDDGGRDKFGLQRGNALG
jgi:hypothetical protein